MLAPRSIHPIFTTLVTTTIVAMNACVDEVDDELANLAPETIETIENLEAAGYPRSEIEVEEDETVIVGGDAVVSLEASREMLGNASDAGFRQYSTNNLVDPAVVQTICVDRSGLAASPLLYKMVPYAISSFNELDLRFEMIWTNGAPTHCDAEITTKIVSGSGGLAGFPSGGRPYHEIELGEELASKALTTIKHVIMHELGHCVGLRHSDYFARWFSCGSGGSENVDPYGANHIPGTNPWWDPDSVMNSCYSAFETGTWSNSDELALWVLYAD